MIRAVCMLFALSAVALAAPPPKESADNKLRRLWGETLDPEKDCTFTLDGARLRIKIPGTEHRFTPYDTDKSSAPRARREIAGDFDIRVQVVSITPPGPKTNGSGMTAGGLFIGTTDDTFVTMSRYTTKADDGESVQHQFLFQHHFPNASGSGLSTQGDTDKEKPVHVRLVREKTKISGYTSPDGQTWAFRGSQEFAWPEKVFVGVFTSHGVDHPVEGVFENLTLTQPAKTK